MLFRSVRFSSATWRLFSLEGLEDACEDYGDAVRYRGTIRTQPEAFTLDDHHTFAAGEALPVCRNTLLMLSQTRLAPHFEVVRKGGRRRGLFTGCGDAIPFRSATGLETEGDAAERSAASRPNRGTGCC